jgi:hypothetical protein
MMRVEIANLNMLNNTTLIQQSSLVREENGSLAGRAIA